MSDSESDFEDKERGDEVDDESDFNGDETAGEAEESDDVEDEFEDKEPKSKQPPKATVKTVSRKQKSDGGATNPASALAKVPARASGKRPTTASPPAEIPRAPKATSATTTDASSKPAVAKKSKKRSLSSKKSKDDPAAQEPAADPEPVEQEPVVSPVAPRESNNETAEDGDTPKKKKKKKTISNELKAKMRGEDPRSKILHAMYKRNRPGNVGTVEGFTKHKIPKGIVQGTLDELAKSGELCVKDGKNKVYWFNQDHFKVKGTDMVKLAKAITNQTEDVGALQAERGELQKELSHLESEPIEDDLDRFVSELTQKCGALRDRVAAVRSASVDVNPAEREKQRKKFSTYRDAWTTRKRQCNAAVGSIADSMQKTLAEMEKLVGVENDGDANVVIPPFVGAAGRTHIKPVIKLLKKKS